MSANDSDVSESDSDYGPQVPVTDTSDVVQGSLNGNKKRRFSETDRENEEKERAHKKQKVSDVWLDRLPSSEWYEYSWMHKTTVNRMAMAPNYDFLITASTDGIIKFWKKNEIGIEFVKQYRAHCDAIECLEVSLDGTLLISIGNDKRCCVFDIVSFDLILKFELTYLAGVCCWISDTLVAITEKNQSAIRIYKPKVSTTPMATLTNIHNPSAKIRCLRYNTKYECCVSSDSDGNIEFWSTQAPYLRTSNLLFEYLMETELVLFRRDAVIPITMQISHNSELIVIRSNDDCIRLFEFKTGKLMFTLHEITKNMNDIDSIEFGKRVAVERQMNNGQKYGNIVYDASDKYIIYATMMGIKMISTRNGSLCRLIGKQETNVRFVNIALFQGVANVIGRSQSQKLGLNSIISSDAVNEDKEDPSIFATGHKRNRFYMFSNRTNKTDQHRDIQNEKPTRMHSKIATHATHRTLGSNAIIRTTFGDIYIKLFPMLCPKTVENFTVHSMNGYYNNCIFHRVIRGFCIQTGDPKGDSTGGKSIWGNVFDDEFHKSLKHDRPGTVSMANAGKNTNGSQFFITTTEAKWLDNKHTIFGRVTKGMDVVQAIECVKCDRVSKNPVEA
eukprot:389121_1